MQDRQLMQMIEETNLFSKQMKEKICCSLNQKICKKINISKLDSQSKR